jgi:hypothetical protein
MYVVLAKNNRPLTINGSDWFNSYEQARSALRSYLRKQLKKGKVAVTDVGYFDDISRNPSRITQSGLRIKRIFG